MIWNWFNRHSRLITVILALGMLGVFALLFFEKPEEPSLLMGYSSETEKARVTEIVEEGEVTFGELTQGYQVVQVEILEGLYAGQSFELIYGKNQVIPESYLFKEGDKIYVAVANVPNVGIKLTFVDYDRTWALVGLVAFFMVLTVAVSGWKGVRSLLSVLMSLLIIVYYIVPQILAGKNPVWVSLIGSIVFLGVTQYLVYGWTLKTHVALAGMFVSIVLTGLMIVFFVNSNHLSGFGDENAMFLAQQVGSLSMRNLLIAGMLIGTLGVLDDLVIGQASAVIQIYRANSEMTFKERFGSAMEVGRDHVGATVNTLVLAYLGTFLSMILLVEVNGGDFLQIMNLSYVAEEIVRSLVGTSGLFLAVPITTVIACWAVDDEVRLNKLVRWFGPLVNIHEGHGHVHSH